MNKSVWIYKTICLNSGGSVFLNNGETMNSRQPLGFVLDVYGKEGWELATSFTSPLSGITTIIFKKQTNPTA